MLVGDKAHTMTAQRHVHGWKLASLSVASRIAPRAALNGMATCLDRLGGGPALISHLSI
jgi:hypothetical protein